MKIFSTEGVILNTVDFGNSNRVVTLYTKDFGKLEVNAYGCRKARSPLSGAIQMFNRINAEISEGSQVDSIRDATVLTFYDNLRTDIERMSYAAIFFEVVNKMTLPKIFESGVYDLLLNALDALNKKNPQIAALIAIAQFMEFTGFQLNFKSCVRCGKKIIDDASISFEDGGAVCESCSHGAIKGYEYSSQLRSTVETFLNFDWHDEKQVNFSARQVHAAQKIFFDYVQNVLGKELNSIKFLRQTYTLK